MRLAAMSGALLSFTALAACSTDAEDFRQSAEDYLEGDSVTEQAGTSFSDAECGEPQSTAAGTTFGCTATAEDGTEWRFVVTIVDDDNFEISGQPTATP